MDISSQNEVLLEFLLSYVKSHDAAWIPQSFYRQLLRTLTSSSVGDDRFLQRSRSSRRCSSNASSDVSLSVWTRRILLPPVDR